MNTTASSNIVSGGYAGDIPIDSPQWFEWVNQQASFRFEGRINFTCTRRPNGKWYGVKKIHSSDKGNVPIALYIGADQDCSLAKLQEIHDRFLMAETGGFWQWYHSAERKAQRKNKPKSLGVVHEKETVQPDSTELENLKSRLAGLEQENKRLNDVLLSRERNFEEASRQIANLKSELSKAIAKEKEEAEARLEELEEGHRVTQSKIIGIDLEEFYDAVLLKHPPRERKIIAKPMQRFKALIAEALRLRGVSVR